MKTLLIATHQISFDLPVSLYCSMGVLTLATALKKRNLQCEIPDLFDYNNLYNSDYDTVLNSIVKNIVSSKPDILGFSTMANNIPIALELANRVKQTLSEVHIIFGGPGTASCAQEILLNFPQVDLIIRGEADHVFPEYIESLVQNQANKTLNGLVYCNNQKIIDNGWPEPVKSLDSLPLPCYEFISKSHVNANNVNLGGFGVAIIEVGRGCPFSCSFCSTSTFFSRNCRLKSTERVIEEILLIQKRLGSVRILFNHDNFTVDRKYVLELCSQIQKKVTNPDWACFASLSTLDQEMYTKMHEAGCKEIFVGLDAATTKMQKLLNKKLVVNEFDVLINIARHTEITIVLAFIVGFPEEDDNDIKEIFSFAIKTKYLIRSKVKLNLNKLTPLVGTPIYETWKNKLVYDEYGSRATTDIPLEWDLLRQTIQKHPEIFSVYFNPESKGIKSLKDSKYESIGRMLEKIMIASVPLAYEWLGEGIAEMLVNHIDEINLPKPTTLGYSEPVSLAESVREIINRALVHEPVAQKMYDAVAKYEIANFDVSQTKSSNYYATITVLFDPVWLIEKVNKLEAMKKVAENLSIDEQPFNLVISWDEKQNTLKLAKIGNELMKLLEKTPETPGEPTVEVYQ